MKKLLTIILSLVVCCTTCVGLAACGNKADYTVGICQYMVHDPLDQATNGFMDALQEELQKEGKTVAFDKQNGAGDPTLCSTIIGTFVAKNVNLIMANATPALTAAATATSTIPVLGTSVTDYASTFNNEIPANVSGTSDAVPFSEQAQMMIDTLGLVAGDTVGVLYCTNESNSVIQYEAVKALFEQENIIVTAYTFSETTEIQAIVGNAVTQIDALYIPSDNTVAENDAMVGTLCEQAGIPVYTSYGGSICYASLAINYYDLGKETGKMAAEILLGKKKVSEIEVKTLTPSVSFNTALCNKLGIAIPDND